MSLLLTLTDLDSVFVRNYMSSSSTLSRKMSPYNVIVEGNIGSGKTTFLEYFKKCDDVCVLAESADLWKSRFKNNLLGLMREDIKKWSFRLINLSFKSYVLLKMMQQHTLPTTKSIKLMERSIYSARYCFIEKMKTDKLIPPASAVVVDEWFDWIKSNTAVDIDLIVYLRTTPEVVHERIMSRNRQEEKSVTLQYLQELHVTHENWLYHKTSGSCPAPVIVLDADLDRSQITQEYEKYSAAILNKVPVQV